MQPYLARFLENNDTPSESVLQEVKDLLSVPLQELEKKKAEIERVNKTLEDLEKERQVIQKSVTEYATILSPIRRIPSDILQEIFYLCLPTHRNPIMSITEAPLLLTRISQSWRSIALSSHRIWSKLHVPLLPPSLSNYESYNDFSDEDMVQLRQKRRELAEKYARISQARSELAQIWLSRSGSCPLSISLNFFGGFAPILPSDLEEGNPLFHLFDTIISFSERFDDLELSMPFEIYQVLQRNISIDMIPNLRNLRVNFFERVTPNPNIPKNSVILLQAPNLQTLSLLTDNVGIATFDARNIPSAWENLTHLFSHSPITSAEAVQVLQRCQNLERCKLVISDGQDVYLGPEETLSLPHLRFLCIQISGTDAMALIYRRISAPILNSFEYQSYHRFPPDYGHTMAAPHSSPVLSLLEKSGHIRKLSIDPRILSAQDILFSFRFASKLTHLILGQRPRDGRPLADEYGHGHGPYWMGFGNFNLNLLVIDEESGPTSSFSVSGKELLLPALEVFEGYMTANVTDETLLKFILSRLGDPARKGVSSLKTVKVAFERSKQKDICDEIYQRAKDVGLEIVLDIFYSPEPFSHNISKYSDVLSPWYGLSDDDRSWSFSDDGLESS